MREEQPRLRAEGRHVGIGVVCYVEGTGIGPYEGAKVQVQASGKVSVATGIGTQGQGHYTSFAQIVADQVGVDVRDVDVVTGDTDQFYWGAGTFASRGAVVAGNAVNEAAHVGAQEDPARRRRAFRVRGRRPRARRRQASRSPACRAARSRLGELAVQANPMRGAVAPGTEPGLEATSYFGPPCGATATGVHAMIVEVDPETMMLEIRKYVVVHDCGTVINPLILEGQIHGGVAQGIGNAFYEQLVFDERGPAAQRLARRLPAADRARRAAHGARAHGDAVAAQPARHQGRGRGRRDSGRRRSSRRRSRTRSICRRAAWSCCEIPLSPCRLWELAG